MKNALIFAVLFFTGICDVRAQLQCGTDHAISQYFTAHPEEYAAFVKKELQFGKTAFQKSSEDTTLYIIPVVFHVLHMNGNENISDAQIIDGINILNRDMKKLNADTAEVLPEFRHLIGKLNIEFRLATIDPDGNCTNGIDRIYTSHTNYGSDSAKLNPWPREKYLNIWTAKALQQGWAGYAYYPSAADGAMEVHDGLMVLANYVGSIGTSSETRSRTLTHEVGHWLDLGHPWNTTINISINVGLACGDDLVPDTPVTKGHTNCPSNLRTPDCTIEAITENYLTFDDVTTTSGTVDLTPAPSALQHFINEPFQAHGLGANPSTAGEFSFSGWDTGATDGETSYSALSGALNSSKYYEFTIMPDTGYTATLSAVSFRVKRSPNGPRTFAIRSSTTGYSASIEPEAGEGVSIQSGNVLFFDADNNAESAEIIIPLSGPAYTNMYQPLTLRFYAWNSETATGEFAIDSVSLSGTTGVTENIQNYMEYSYCCYMWTKGQCDRMLAALNSPLSGRNNLWTPANLTATGVLTPSTGCVPQADFYASSNRVCTGKTVQFTMNEANADATSQSWTFEGGTPSTSAAATPSVTYSAPGLYAVTLTTSNSVGSTSITKQSFIRVDDGSAIDATNGFSEPFEVAADFTQEWQVINPDSNANRWSYVQGAGYNGSNAVCIGNGAPFYLESDELVSPYYDLSETSTSLNFKIAAASKQETGNGDKLVVYYKKNCDASWSIIKTYLSLEINNNPAQAEVFVPDAASAWTTRSVNISSSYRTDAFQFKFVYSSDFGTNRVYIDDINIGPVALSTLENHLENPSFSIYPVPSDGSFNVAYNLTAPAQTQITVVDISGKTVLMMPAKTAEAGPQQEALKIDAGNGLYFVILNVDGKNFTLKQIVN